MDKVVIWGASGHALVVADIIRLMGGYQVEGYLDSVDPQRSGEPLGDGVILGGEEQLPELRAAGVGLIAFGIGDCAARMALADVAVTAGFGLFTAIHPSATVAAGVQIGAGSVLCAGSVVNPGALLGRLTIVNTCASVDHECEIGDGVHLSPGVHLAGRVSVGEGTSVGVGAVARDGISVGKGCIIGAGAVVVSDLPDNVLAYGVPAKIVRENQ
jgi:sugar O-acyltransferase (sialic acid O-acetyltransferase NeuD family)